MLEFSINSKEFGELVKKVVAGVNKKAFILQLRSIFFQIDENKTLKVTSTDTDQWIEVKTDSIWNCSPGVFGIEVEDLKLILKMSGEIHFKDISDDKKNLIIVKCGKRELTIQKVINIDYFLPDMDDTEIKVLETTECWLHDTIINLSTFTSSNTSNQINPNQMMNCINFNTREKTSRVTALEGHKVGMRVISDQIIYSEQENINLKADLALPVLKTILNKTSDKKVTLSFDKKWIKIAGLDFTYLIRKVDGKYFDVDKIIPEEFNYCFKANTNSLLESMKYSKDLIGKERLPFVFYKHKEKLYSYTAVSRYETLEELEVTDLEMKDNEYVGFNSSFWVDALTVADSDEVTIKGRSAVEPAMIYANEYTFLILPVNLKASNVVDRMMKKFEKAV